MGGKVLLRSAMFMRCHSPDLPLISLTDCAESTGNEVPAVGVWEDLLKTRP